MLKDIILSFLRHHNIRLNTDLGQHFLIDEQTLNEIVETARLVPEDRIVEIGPGIGILTAELLKRTASVTAIEIDERFIGLLKEFINQNLSPVAYHLSAIHGNALHIPMPETPYKVVANIPYHITSPLLHHLLLETKTLPRSLTLLIQLEVAENICDPFSSNLLSVLVKLFGKPKFIRKVPKEAFLPPPKVDSAVINIDIFETPQVEKETAKKILNLARHAFSNRRKMLSNTIGKLPGGSEALNEAGIDQNRRPETLKTEEWIQLQAAIESGQP